MNRAKAIHFLSLGLPPGQVASIVGVSPSRISQLLSEPSVKELIEEKQLERQTENEENERLEAKVLAAKNSLLDSLATRQHEATYMELARAYQIICAASAPKNAIPVPGATIFNGTVVQIAMPARTFQQEIQITADKEVIAIGDRELAPLTANAVTALFKRMKDKEGECNEPENLLTGPEKGTGAVVQAAA